MGSFSIWHWLIVLLIVVMVFGTKKLKNIGSDLAKVTQDTARTTAETIDVEARQKS